MTGEMAEERLLKAIQSGDPLSVGIVCYQTVRESHLFNKWKILDNKEKMEELVKESIVKIAVILRDSYSWDADKINVFLKHMQELVKEI